MIRLRLKQLWCTLTLRHIDPGTVLIAQRIFVCKRCGKVLSPKPAKATPQGAADHGR